MPLPGLDGRGLLPDGIHDGTLEEIEAGFCTNDHRRQLWSRFIIFLGLLRKNVNAGDLVLAGSFFSDKADPGDIEATLVTGDDIGLIGVAMLFMVKNHAECKKQLNVDFYVTLPGQNSFVDFWRYVGPKTAKQKGLRAKAKRGVVKVNAWATG